MGDMMQRGPNREKRPGTVVQCAIMVTKIRKGGLAMVLAVAALVISIIALVSLPDTYVLPSSPLDVTKAAPAEYTVAVVERAIRLQGPRQSGSGAVLQLPGERGRGLVCLCR